MSLALAKTPRSPDGMLPLMAIALLIDGTFLMLVGVYRTTIAGSWSSRIIGFVTISSLFSPTRDRTDTALSHSPTSRLAFVARLLLF
jgi:hypothetical protein